MMYMIVFQLRSAESELVTERLAAALKSLGDWSSRLDGMWLLQPNRPVSASQIRDHLKQFMGAEDSVFVARISQNWAGKNMGAGFPEWMSRREFGRFKQS
jgi:hypothetical protein